MSGGGGAEPGSGQYAGELPAAAEILAATPGGFLFIAVIVLVGLSFVYGDLRAKVDRAAFSDNGGSPVMFLTLNEPRKATTRRSTSRSASEA